jgi:hypothetical protein
MLPLRLDASNAKDLPVIEALRGAGVPMTGVPVQPGPHGVGAAAAGPGGVTSTALPRRGGSSAAGGDASPVAYVVDVKDVLLLGTKDALELVVTKYIHGCVTVFELPDLDCCDADHGARCVPVCELSLYVLQRRLMIPQHLRSRPGPPLTSDTYANAYGVDDFNAGLNALHLTAIALMEAGKSGPLKKKAFGSVGAIFTWPGYSVSTEIALAAVVLRTLLTIEYHPGVGSRPSLCVNAYAHYLFPT